MWYLYHMRRRWNDDEIKGLLEAIKRSQVNSYDGKINWAYVAMTMGRSEVACKQKWYLDVRCNVIKQTKNNWTSKEDKILIDLYGNTSLRRIVNKLIRETGYIRSFEAIKRRANKLGLVMSHSEHISMTDAANELGVSRNTLKRLIDRENEMIRTISYMKVGQFSYIKMKDFEFLKEIIAIPDGYIPSIEAASILGVDLKSPWLDICRSWTCKYRSNAGSRRFYDGAEIRRLAAWRDANGQPRCRYTARDSAIEYLEKFR